MKNWLKSFLKNDVVGRFIFGFVWLIVALCGFVNIFIVGNYYDLITGLLVVIIMLSMFGVYYLIKKIEK